MGEADGRRRFTLNRQQEAELVRRLLAAWQRPGVAWDDRALAALCRAYEALTGQGAGHVIADVTGGDDRQRETWDRLLRDVDMG
jgi:hypothetical protein